MTSPLPFETALAPLLNLRRWVTYDTYPDEDRPGKTIKRPTDVSTGLWCKVADPAHHYSYAEAIATGRPVGFVFVEGDGFWFLDIDGALVNTPTGPQWSQLAVTLCERFPLAAVEISQSYTGLHIIGRGFAPPHACKNVPLGLEFYTDGRFVALTGTSLRGDAGADYGAALPALVAEYFPHNPHGDVAGWRGQPAEEWAGPEDDGELLRAALASGKRNAAAAFGDAAHVTFADLWEANADALARKWPGNTNGYDASQVDAALAAQLAFWTGKNHERTRNLMYMSALVRQKWEDRPEWLETTIMRAASVVTNVAKGRNSVAGPLVGEETSEAERRRQQCELTRQIGEGSENVPTTTIFTLEKMLARFVFIKDGSQVADRLRPQVVLPLSEFKNSTAGSLHPVPGDNGRLKVKPCAVVWLGHAKRLDAETLTFKPGASVMTVSPAHGKSALNLWSPPIRDDAPPDWQERAGLFANHVRWLWGDNAEPFFDWLAHIEQRPGELPHFGWVHISRIHGKGRNWISAVLARLWRGNVAASFDLLGALQGGFNDRLSRCLLAIVDEINEGGGGSWRHAQSLRQMVTAEHREINPKYGRRHVEYNCTRWLLFSNHTGALPLDADDRRFWVVDHEGPVMPPAYYKGLYSALNDPNFIFSVAKFLGERDISGFDAGMRPPITKAKAALLALAQSESDALLTELVQRWPVDVISWGELRRLLPEGECMHVALRYPLDRAGIKRLRKVRTGEKSEPVYSLRGHDLWAEAIPKRIRAEIDRIGFAEKEAALSGYDALATVGG